jgi:hypothetical protein
MQALFQVAFILARAPLACQVRRDWVGINRTILHFLP